ncbi:MAG: HAMP domain-containing histidine kinase [Candidatus Kapabacteria bacterium]|nr:HAMP domain-containing histidine kinase [Candidatus Kapabacteria bacterium]
MGQSLSGFIETLGAALQLYAPAVGDHTLALQQAQGDVPSSKRVCEALHSIVEIQHDIHNSLLLFVNHKFEIQPPYSASPERMVSKLFLRAQQWQEEGLLMKILESREPFVVPMQLSSFDCPSSVLIIPLLLRGAGKAYFIGESVRPPQGYDADELAHIAAYAESAAQSIDNNRSAEELHVLTTRISLMNDQLSHTSKLASLGQLTGTVAHEINNPLQIMTAHLQLLENGVGDSARRIQIIKEQCNRLIGLSRRLLDYSRTGTDASEIEQHNASTVVRDVLSFIEAQFTRDSIKIITHFESDDLYVRCRRHQIEQVLLNLCMNARDAMPSGGTLTVGVFSMDDTVVISIADTGIGIDAEHCPRIFDAYFTTKPKGKGTGLGLSIVRSIIEHHGGSVRMVSERGKGSTFKCTLPRVLNTAHRTQRRHVHTHLV